MSNLILHKRSVVVNDGIPKLPTPEQLEYGELAINFADGHETLTIKNSADEIAEFKSKEYFENIIVENELVTSAALNDLNERVKVFEENPPISLQEITYGELVTLRNNGELIPGQLYRIIDYVTTTSQVGTQSAEHAFDVIVTALDTNILSEEARAIQHEGDTYFANSDLNAWEIWYCLDNDTSKFAWANAENGKGVIYRMIDEFGNDCPYDFKNIQFKRNLTNGTLDAENGTDTWCYTFNAYNEDSSEIQDASVIAQKEDIEDDANRCYGNIINYYCADMNNDGAFLNNIVFLNLYSFDNDIYFRCYKNSFENNCNYNSFGHNCNENSFGNNCGRNSFGNNCSSNSFGNECNYNLFGNDCCYNSFENNCNYNSFGHNCNENSFGNNCGRNSFGNDCYGNSFGNDFSRNSFGNSCYGNSFGNDCSHNSFRTSASTSGTVKNYCYYNHFDDGCSYNVIWNADTASSSYKLQNVNITRGVSGTSSAYNMINIDTINAAYEIKVSKNSSGAIKVYCEADLIQ